MVIIGNVHFDIGILIWTFGVGVGTGTLAEMLVYTSQYVSELLLLPRGLSFYETGGAQRTLAL